MLWTPTGAYHEEPFELEATADGAGKTGATVDTSEIDTIVVPAREEGFQETVLGENRWHAIRMHSSMTSKIKHLAVYRVAPISAVTHLAAGRDIEPWKSTGKYTVTFTEPSSS